MKYLLDTHALIWFIEGDDQLSAHALRLMEDEGNELFISVASLWEMAVKVSIGKLNLAQPFEALFPIQLESNSIEILDISVDNLEEVSGLPFHHRDPFDRLMIAQAKVEGFPIINVDAAFDAYDVRREW